MKLLFHCCCAPCSVLSVKSLLDESFEPHLFWYNPNIHPFTEYKSRLESLRLFADNENLKLEIEGEYGLDLFLDTVYKKEENRCELCYRMRLEKTAAFAAEKGFEYFSTSLLISPYQDHELIKKVCEAAAAKYGVKFLYRDFRSLFYESKNAARSMGFYMQKYCGCIFSEHERYSIKKEDYNSGKEYFQRLQMLMGENSLEKLKNTKVIVFGAGGVGSWCAEGLVRCGIGKIDIVDFDKIAASNVNRQLQATSKTLGKSKVEVLKQRLLEINPACCITAHEKLFSFENAGEFNIENFNYVIDAIDMVTNKIDLIQSAISAGATLFSSMGMALKTDPGQIKIASIWETKGCPLARLVRQGLKKRGFNSDFTVVYSSELLQKESSSLPPSAPGGKRVNGSVVTVTASAGFFLASLVINSVVE